ncbi:hypothetical protein QTP88_020446 [Uroleucon formosanum]
MTVKQTQNNLRKIIKKNFKKVTFTDPPETQKNFNEGTNLENEPENIKELVQLEQNLKNKFKKSDLSHSEKKLNNLRKDEYEDEYYLKKLQEKEYSPANLEKIINIEKKLKSNYRKRVIDDKHSAEEKIKNFEPILEGLSKVEKSINNVKEVSIKTDNDIQRLIPTTTNYRPRNPDVLRLLSTDDYENDQTPKSSPIKIKNSSPLPPDTILGKYSSTALASLPKNNVFGINYNKITKQHSLGKEIITFNLDNIILKGKERKITPGMWCLLTESNVPNANDYTKEDLDKYKQLLIETDSIYKNNDRSTGGAKSSGVDKYMKLISPIWKEIKGEKTPTTPTEILNPTIPDFPTIPITTKPKNPTIPTTEILKPTILTTDILKPTIATENKGAGLMNYTNNEIEYCWIDNMKQLNERLHLIAAEEKAGNYVYHNEKLGILKLFKKKMEHLIDDRKEKNEEQNIQPINELDKAAREHDYFYKNHKDTKSRHIADKILEQKALERYNDPNSSMSEKFLAFLTAYTMKGKRHLGMNLISHKNDTNATFQIASNKIFKGENIYYLDKIQLDKLKNAKEKKSGVRLEIRSSQIKDKKGGFLPLIFAGIGAASALVGGVTSIVNTVNDYKHKKAMEKETIRHNKEMENKGSGLKKKKNKKNRKNE